MKIIDKSGILKRMKVASGVSSARLPKNMGLSIENGVLRCRVNTLNSNMQKDEAAFESWVIVLKAYLPEINHVEVDFTIPHTPGSNHVGLDFGHYNRFLYRLYNMTRLFPDWFFIASSKKKTVADFICWLDSNRCLINHSPKDKKSVYNKNHKERRVESWFVFEDKDKLLCNLLDIDEEKFFNQVAVGVYYESIEKSNTIFPGGAVDMLGISRDGDGLHLIELKCGANQKIGVISETLFYTAVIYDTYVSKNPLFSFGNKKTKETKEMHALYNGGERFSHLTAHILAESYHPLFQQKVEELIADGFSSLGIVFSRQLYEYMKIFNR